MTSRTPHAEWAAHAGERSDDGDHSLHTESSSKKAFNFLKLGRLYLITHLGPLLVLLVTLAALLQVLPQDLWLLLCAHLQHNLVSVLTCSTLVVFVAAVYVMSCSPPTYLVDYTCVKPPPELMVSYSLFRGNSEKSGLFDAQSLNFQRKILERSGLGEQTYLPHVMHVVPPRPAMSAACAEAEDVMFGALISLFDRTGIKPKDIDLLVVNCSIFNPIPSLSAMIINKFKLRSNIRSYTLSGMGCSAGVISIDLVKKLLQVHRNSYAVVVSMENITQNWYFGNCKSMLLPNCLFRMGGAAILLTNKRSERRRAKYQLLHTVRTHKGADDEAFYCVYQQEDEKGSRGVSLSKHLMAIAANALRANITTLGPLVLPISEQLRFLAALVARKVLKVDTKSYIPDFKLAFEHFCIHAGGRAVIDELEKNLKLSARHVEASRMTLHRFGNTSSSSIWYELAYTEAKDRVRRGDRVWQIAFGSGFKCNSAVWRALRSGKLHADSPWADCIDHYPVFIPDVVSSN